MRLFRWVRPQGRRVFGFRLNGRTVWRDPILVRQRLKDADEKWSELVDLVAAGSRPVPDALNLPDHFKKARQDEAEANTRRLADVVAAGFNVPPLQDDATGMTQEELISLMADFLNWCHDTARAYRPL